MIRLKLIWLVGLLWASSGFASTSNPSLQQLHGEMRYLTENYPPANFFEDDKLVGVSVDMLHEIWQRLDLPKKTIHVVPWARGYREVEQDSNSMLFTMSRTKERDSHFKWVGPVFSSTHVLVAKIKTPIEISKQSDMFNYNVSTVRGDISEKSLKEIDFPNHKMAKVANVKQAFLMLKNDRVELVMLSIHGLHHVLAELHESRNRYKVVWEVNKIGNYYAFNKATPDKLINAFQQVLDSIEPERIKILEKYRIPEEEY